MICNQCGRYMPDNSRFCPSCGASVQIAPVYQPAPQQPVYQNPQQPPHFQYGQPLDLPDTPRQAALKKLARSPIMLIAAIAFTLNLVVSLISTFALSDQLAALATMLNELIGESGSISFSVDLFGSVSGMIPNILIAVALWITYGAGFKKRGMSAGGLVMLKVLNIISLVGICVLCGIFLLGYGIGAFAGAMTEEESSVGVVLLIVGIVMAAICAFAIILQARVVGSLSAAIEVAKTGRTSKKVSMFYGVLLMISSVSTALCALSLMGAGTLVKELIYNIPELQELPAELLAAITSLDYTMMALPNLLTALSGIMFALLIFKYKSNVQNLVVVEAPVQNYAYPYPPVAPVPPAVPVAPVVEEPAPAAVEEPVVEEAAPAVVEEPVVEEPVPAAVEEPVAEEAVPAVVEEPVVEEAVPAVVEEPVVEEAAPAAVEEPVVEEPIAEEPAAEEPVDMPVFVPEVPAEEAAPVEEAPAFVFCTECGQKLVPTAKFCSRCGHPQ